MCECAGQTSTSKCLEAATGRHIRHTALRNSRICWRRHARAHSDRRAVSRQRRCHKCGHCMRCWCLLNTSDLLHLLKLGLLLVALLFELCFMSCELISSLFLLV